MVDAPEGMHLTPAQVDEIASGAADATLLRFALSHTLRCATCHQELYSARRLAVVLQSASLEADEGRPLTLPSGRQLKPTMRASSVPVSASAPTPLPPPAITRRYPYPRWFIALALVAGAIACYAFYRAAALAR